MFTKTLCTGSLPISHPCLSSWPLGASCPCHLSLLVAPHSFEPFILICPGFLASHSVTCLGLPTSCPPTLDEPDYDNFIQSFDTNVEQEMESGEVSFLCCIKDNRNGEKEIQGFANLSPSKHFGASPQALVICSLPALWCGIEQRAPGCLAGPGCCDVAPTGCVLEECCCLATCPRGSSVPKATVSHCWAWP